MELEEIKAYSNRLEKEYLELLSLRKGILAQIEQDKAEAEIAKRNKEVILGANADLIGEANKSLNNIKKQKEDFVNDLDKRVAILSEKEGLLKKTEEDLKIKAQQAETAQQYYEDLTEAVKNEKKKIEETLKEEQENIRNLEACESEVKKVFEINQKDRERVKVACEMARDNELRLKKIEEGLKLKEEEVSKRENELVNQRKMIEDDRLHLYSQQNALKYAWEETKRKLEEAKEECQK